MIRIAGVEVVLWQWSGRIKDTSLYLVFGRSPVIPLVDERILPLIEVILLNRKDYRFVSAHTLG